MKQNKIDKRLHNVICGLRNMIRLNAISSWKPIDNCMHVHVEFYGFIWFSIKLLVVNVSMGLDRNREIILVLFAWFDCIDAKIHILYTSFSVWNTVFLQFYLFHLGRWKELCFESQHLNFAWTQNRSLNLKGNATFHGSIPFFFVFLCMENLWQFLFYWKVAVSAIDHKMQCVRNL